MMEHQRTRLHQLEVSTGSGPPDGDDIQGDSTGNVLAMSGSKENSSLSDIWRMTSPSEIAAKLVLMTQAPRICFEMKNDGVLPLLVQFLHQHSTEDGMLAITGESVSGHELENGSYHQPTSDTFRSTLALRRNSAKALRNIVSNTSKNKKELEILGLLEDLRSFVEIFYLKWSEMSVEAVDHPCSQLADIFAFACDSNYKKTIELYGGIYVISDVIQSDFRFHRNRNTNEQCFLLRQYSLNVLTYMTAQNDSVKSMLGSMRPFIGMLVETLQEAPQLDNLQLLQSVANVLHNLSWKSDYNSKQIMRDVKTVYHLAKLAMEIKDIKTLKALLEPLLNLTAHCTPNKVDFCKVDGVLDFLISKLATSTSITTSSNPQLNPTELAIVENSGGILRNVSSYLVTREDLIEQLRARNIVAILLEQLKAASLAIVSNACIILSYLAARSPQDALKIKELGGLQILHGLTNSKHDSIKLGASKTLQHLFTSHLANYNASFKESPTMSTSYSIPSSLQMRKLKAFKTEINSFISENYDTLQGDISPNDSPKHSLNRSLNSNAFNINSSLVSHSTYSAVNGVQGTTNNSNNFHKVSRSSSHDSIGSTHSEPGTKMNRRSVQSASEHNNNKNAAAAAFMNLAKSSASPHDQRMIHSYSGQTINSIYATLPANSRICEKNHSMESANDAASDYDISICDISGSLSCPPIKASSGNGGNNGNTSSSTDYLEEEDPAPTDYSQRFKEQVIDDFSTPQSASKNDSTCEDTVKVYQTENTPLAFSLAPSLSDLRDVGPSSFSSSSRGPMDENKHKQMQDLSDRFSNSLDMNKSNVQMEKLFKKPILAPKPPVKMPHSSTSAYNLKIPYSINEEGALESESPNRSQNSAKSGLAKSMSNHESLKYCAQMSGPKKIGEMSEPSSQQYNRSNSMCSMMYNNNADNFNMTANENTGNNHWTPGKSPGRWSTGKQISSSSIGRSSGMTTPLRNVIATSVNRQADSLEHFATNDSSCHFATEDTPAIFSHATSLSSLSMDDLDCTVDEFENEQKNAETATSQNPNTYVESEGPRVSLSPSTNSPSASEQQKNNQQEEDNNAATYQNTNTVKSSTEVQNAPLVKSTPVAAKRASKLQVSQNMAPQATYVQFFSESDQSPPPPPRPPKKPLPALPPGESPPRMHAPLPPTSTIIPTTSVNDDDDYDDFIYKCRQVALPKECSSSTKPKSPPKSTTIPAKPSNSNVSKNAQPMAQANQVGTSTTRTNSSQPSNTRVYTKTESKTKNTNNSSNSLQNKQASNRNKADLSNTDEEDDFLLNQCMQVAINKQSHSTKASSKKASVRHSLSTPSREGKSPRIYKKNPAASSSATNSNTQHHMTHVLKLPNCEPSPVDQEQHFFVEDTPVHFSQCHSPLSSLFDSGDEIEDHKLVEAAMQFDACRSKAAIGAKAISPAQEMSETESESGTTTLTITTANNAAGTAHSFTSHVRTNSNSSRSKQSASGQQQQRRLSPATSQRASNNTCAIDLSANRNPERQTAKQQYVNNKGNGNAPSGRGTAAGRASRSSVTSAENAHSSLQEDDDERTYTICTQSSRNSSATLTAGVNQSGQQNKASNTSALVMSTYSSSTGSVHNIEGENPPSLVDDHNLMFSSTETNMTRSGLKFIAVPRANSARTKKSTAGSSGQLGYELSQTYGQQPHSLEDHSANSFLENQKPPSIIMEHSSFMSQSTGSITSEISDIAFDQVPIRKSSSDLVAEMASNTAKEIANLADQLCLNGNSSASVDGNCSAHSSLSASSSTGNSRRMAVQAGSKNDMYIEARSDRTFELEPSPTPRTLLRNASSSTNTTNTGTTTVTVGRASSSNTRTYNKTDKTRNTNTTERTLKAKSEEVADADLDDSDTDISENLPLDEVQTRELSHTSPTKHCSPRQLPSIPMYGNPMDSPKANKKPPPAPRYVPRQNLAPATFELTDDDDDSSDDGRRPFPMGYSHSLNNRRVSRSPRKSSKHTPEVALVQHEFGHPRFGSFSSNIHSLDMEQTHPYSNHHQMAFSSLGRRGYSSSKVKKEKDFEDKDLLFTAKHKNTVVANHAQFFQSKLNTTQNIKSASKYFDRHAAALSSMAHEDQFVVENQSHPNFIEAQVVPLPTSKRSNYNDFSSKPKENTSKNVSKEKEKGPSLLSKLSSSFSSHNIGSHSSNSGSLTPTGASPSTPSSSTKTSLNKINSKIASFWKRSKSTHDKLDQEALTSNTSKNMKASKLNKNVPLQRFSDKPDVLDLNQNQTGLARSSTYEKLPANEEEASRINSRQLENNNNDNNDCTGMSSNCSSKNLFENSTATTRQQTENVHYGTGSDHANSSFTFSTFVKTPVSNICSSVESISTQSSAPSDRFRRVERNMSREQHPAHVFHPENVPSQCDSQTVAANSVEDTSGVSSVSSSSNQQSRKTCLVTTV